MRVNVIIPREMRNLRISPQNSVSLRLGSTSQHAIRGARSTGSVLRLARVTQASMRRTVCSASGSQYYVTINGKKYDRESIEIAEKKAGSVIDMATAQELFESVRDGGQYTDTEKDTIRFIRKEYEWAEDADTWFRDEIRKWAYAKGKVTRARNAAARDAAAAETGDE
eukprot:CAMPEP_0114238528 /NCGR_PEP_ID=MMETSP0058-20121206/7972_1 /TAXON_ID=36894 /ORGANISM="Pyramimonas parkeae, CCMP726" /LENGTH=167 /DNA_ID=CAMNT_0001350643 /DNA_START=99 /DNA_END=602 /DNA_ORIENTATION=+